MLNWLPVKLLISVIQLWRDFRLFWVERLKSALEMLMAEWLSVFDLYAEWCFNNRFQSTNQSNQRNRYNSWCDWL